MISNESAVLFGAIYDEEAEPEEEYEEEDAVGLGRGVKDLEGGAGEAWAVCGPGVRFSHGRKSEVETV